MIGDKQHADLLADNWQWDGQGLYSRIIPLYKSLPAEPLLDDSLQLRIAAESPPSAYVEKVLPPLPHRRRWSWKLKVYFQGREYRICSYINFMEAARAVLGNH